MRPSTALFSFRVLLVFVLLFSLMGVTNHPQPAQAAADKGLPVEQLLKPDGTLDLSSGYSGNLNMTNYGVSLDANLGPVFKPLATPDVWNSLASGLNFYVYAVAISGADVYVGGSFTDAGGNANADYIAKFSGGSWSALGSGLNGSVYAIAFSGSDVYAGGSFTDAGENANADYIAKFSGGSWSVLGSGLNGDVSAIAISGSDVYVGGEFTDAGGNANADYIAKFSGGSWSALGSGLNGSVYAIAFSGSDVYAGGSFIDAGGDANADKIAKFSGGSWSALGTTPLSSTVFAIAISGSDVYAGGFFTDAGGDVNADHIAKFSGGSWSALGATPLNASINKIVISGGDVYASGSFSNAGGDANADYIAKFSGGNWSALGATPLNLNTSSIAISGGDVYAGGAFTDAGGDANADYIARFETAGSSIAVTTVNDVVGDDGVCSLREAIENANGNTNVDPNSCDPGVGADTIIFSNSLGTNTITLGLGGAFLISGANGLTIDGGGDISISSGDPNRLFVMGFNTSLILKNITLRNAGNNSYQGGVMYMSPGSEVVIDHSTLHNNSATDGGAIYNLSSKLWVTNSTFASNTATNTGGSIYNTEGAVTTISNSTFSAHSAGISTDGIYNSASTLVLKNTILSDGGNGDDCVSASGVVFAQNNLIESTGAGACGLTNGVDGNIIGSDPNLGPLTGSPAHLPLNAGSPAINAGDNAICAATPVNNQSQNGVPRPQGAACDIGAVEATISATFKSSAANDGWILESSETSNTGGTLNNTQTTFILGDDSADKQYRAILHFDTSALPDTAVVTNMTLKIKQQGIVTGTSPFTFGSLYVDMRNPAFGGSALELTDFNFAAKKVKPAVFNPTPVSGWFSARFNTGGKLYVNRTGVSQLRLYFSVDDNNNNIADLIRFFSGNAAAGDRPKLLITYYVP